MAELKTDLRDIYFGLFDVLKVQEHRDGAEKTDFSDLRDIIDQFNKFVAAEIWPCRQNGDVEGVKLTKEGVKAPASFHGPLKAYYENGWFALGMPEAAGGMPVPHAVTLACSSIGNGANVAFSMYAGLSKAALNVILAIGTDAQKGTYVEKMMNGTWGGTMCLTEPGAGSDVGAATASAKPLGDGRYSIKGVKIFISSGESDLYQNNIHLVLARTPGAPEGTKGLSLFIVPRFDVTSGKSNNVICTKVEEKMGIHASATCEMTFGKDGECLGELIGKEFDGMANMFIMMNEARLMCGLQGESQANLVTLMSEQYASERVQFGKEIAKHPDVWRLLTKMRSISRGLRALNFYVANLFDVAEKDPAIQDEIALLTPICKSYGSEQGFNVSVDAIQIYGGYGYCQEYGIEQFTRDSKIATIYEGTNGIQAIDFVMRKILRDKGQAFTKLAGKIQNSLKNCAAAKEWSEELALMGQCLEKGQQILQKSATHAAQSKIDDVLLSASDILAFSAHLVMAWQLLDHANLSHQKLSGASGAEKEYYQSKIVDFRFYCRHILSQNLGIAQNLLNFKDNLLHNHV